MRALVFAAAALVAAAGAAVAVAPTAGRAGHALWFDHQRNDVLGVQWATEALDAVTIEFWMKVVDNHLATEAVVAYSEFDASEDPLYDNPDGLQVRFRDSRTCMYRSSCIKCTTDDCKVLGETGWSHYAFSWDSATGEVAYYRDGVQTHTGSGSGRFAQPLTSNGCFVLGHEPDEFCGLFDESQAFDGLLDEFRLWSRVRTPAEIAANYRVRADPADPDLNIYYDFNAPSAGATVADLTGNGNTGLRGQLPSLRQVMAYSTDRGSVLPTPPVYVASTAPLLNSGDVVATVPAAAGRGEVELPASDDDTALLTVTITRLPSTGTLEQVGGGAIALGNNVVHPGEQTKAVVYVAGALAAGAEDTFEYTVSDGVDTAVATVRVSLASVSEPAARALTFDEDERGLAVLGGVNSDGAALETVITALPERGQLYQITFGGASPGLYGDIPADEEGGLVPITAAGTVLSNTRGIVAYKPDSNDFSAAEGEAYATFAYAWRHPGDATLQSGSANVSLAVLSVNDPPASVPANLTLAAAAGGQPAVVQLVATDPDANFAPRNFFTVSQYPRMGSLYQTGGEGASAWPDLERPIADKVAPPTVIAWAAQVLDASSQYSRCDACTDFATCPVCPDGSNDYHANAILGRPDFYPATGDSPLTWSFAALDSGDEHLVLRFPNSVYISGVELFETQVPGSVTRVSAARNWTGDAATTEWHTLWSGAVQNLPEVARVFQPPVCEYGWDTDTVRFDFAADQRSGWNEFDAAKLIGTLEAPPGRVFSAEGRVAYVPAPGVHPAAGAGGAAFDTFSFVASDCEGTSPDAGEITVDLASPSPADASAASLGVWRTATADAPVGRETPVPVDVQGVAADLRARGVAVSADEEAAAEVRLVAVEARGASFDAAKELVARVEGGKNVETSALPMLLPAGGAGLVATQQEKQGVTRFVAWVTLGGYTYRVATETSPECEARLHPDSATGACVPCREVPREEVEAMSEDERVLFESRCPTLVEKSWGLRVAMMAAAGLAGLVMLGMLGGVVYYRAHPIIRYSSPVFCGFILAGCLIGAGSVFVMQAPPSATACTTMPWLLHTAFVLSFASLFAKTYRLAVVFNNEKLRNVRITDTSLFLKVIGSSLALAVAYLAAWTVASPPSTGYASAGGTEWLECQSEGAWGTVPVAVEGFFLVWGVYLCVKTRNNPSAFNESKYIAMAIYNLFVLGAILVPLSLVTRGSPDAPFLLQSAGVVLVTSAVAALLFVPKFYAIYFKVEGAWDTTTPANNGTGTHRHTGSGHKGQQITKDSLQSMAGRIPDPASLAGGHAHDSLQSMADRMAAADRAAAAAVWGAGASEVMDKPASQQQEPGKLEMMPVTAGPVYDDDDDTAASTTEPAFLGDVQSRSHEDIANLEGGLGEGSGPKHI